MSLPQPPSNASRLELRKALVQMRLELHRQQLRHETLLAIQPLQQAHDISRQLRNNLGSGAPILGIAALSALALMILKRKKVTHWLSIGSSVAPVLVAILRSRQQRTTDNPPNVTPAAASNPRD